MELVPAFKRIAGHELERADGEELGELGFISSGFQVNRVFFDSLDVAQNDHHVVVGVEGAVLDHGGDEDLVCLRLYVRHDLRQRNQEAPQLVLRIVQRNHLRISIFTRLLQHYEGSYFIRSRSSQTGEISGPQFQICARDCNCLLYCHSSFLLSLL